MGCRYPLLESLQRFLWPRLCVLDQKTLYVDPPLTLPHGTVPYLLVLSPHHMVLSVSGQPLCAPCASCTTRLSLSPHLVSQTSPLLPSVIAALLSLTTCLLLSSPLSVPHLVVQLAPGAWNDVPSEFSSATSLSCHPLFPCPRYELHYQMITFGKVFCTKRNPNCGACPMQDVCQHHRSKKQA